MKNYKKILALALLSFVFISTLSIVTFAKENVEDTTYAKIHRDFSLITINEERFFYVSSDYSSAFVSNFDKQIRNSIEFELLDEQESMIGSIYSTEYYNKDGDLCVLEISLFLRNSPQNLNFTYVSSAYLSEFKSLLKGEGSRIFFKLSESYEYSINNANLDYSKLKAEPSYTIQSYMFYSLEGMGVYTYNSTKEIFVKYGILFYNNENDKYYYLDYSENNIDLANPNNTDAISPKTYIIHEITHKPLISTFNDARNQNNGFDIDDDIDISENSAFGVIMLILAALVFGVGPLVAAIICFVKAPKMESPYCGLLRAIAVVCSVITFLVALVFIFFLL